MNEKKEVKQLGFRAVKRNCKMKEGRGIEDPESVIETMRDDWDGLVGELQSLPENEKEKIKEHFNSLIDEFDNLGEILFGDIDDFNDTISGMASAKLKQYTDEILRVELIDTT